jgi:hypothetical protein
MWSFWSIIATVSSIKVEQNEIIDSNIGAIGRVCKACGVDYCKFVAVLWYMELKVEKLFKDTLRRIGLVLLGLGRVFLKRILVKNPLANKCSAKKLR